MKTELQIIEDVFKSCNIKLWGFCKFQDIADKLISCRAKSQLPQNSNTIISALFPYYTIDIKHNISRYAFSKDYHIIVMDILKKAAAILAQLFLNFKFVPFCDNSPIPEVQAAALCNLGVIGKNGLLINKNYGSFVFIGEIVTDMPLSYNNNKSSIKSCIGCNKCIEVCPGKALSEKSFTKEFCASFLSQKKGELSPEQQEIIRKSGFVWGCDLCQNFCPMNKNINCTYINEFKNIHPIITLENCDKFDDRAFYWRPIDVIKRNIKITQEGNQD